jgi:hypothetical protein
MRLYELTGAFVALQGRADVSDDGEISAEDLEALTKLELDLAEKLEGCCKVMRSFEATAAAYRTEAERLGRKATVATNNAARLKAYMANCLEQAGIDTIRAGLFGLCFQDSPPSCQVADTVDLGQVPKEFCNLKLEPNRRAAIDAFKAGRPLPEGFVVVQNRSLRIR